MNTSVFARNIQKARKDHQPLFGTLEITQNCNLKCKHCYNFDRSTSPPDRKELSLEEIKETIFQMSELGVLSLNISGGEPLLHPHLDEILEFCRPFHFHLRLKTNGVLLSEKRAREIRALGVKEVDISLYGKDEATYLNFCGKEGFRKAVASIVNAKNSDLKVNVSLILHRLNAEDFTEMTVLLKELKVFFQVSDEITDRYDQSQARDSLAMTKEQYKNLLTGPESHFFTHENPNKDVMCGCAKSVIGINAFGDVFPCIGSPIYSGNIREQNLKTIWKESPPLKKIRDLEFSDFKDCANCTLIKKCSRSSGSAFVNTGKYTACDPTALLFAQARAELDKDK